MHSSRHSLLDLVFSREPSPEPEGGGPPVHRTPTLPSLLASTFKRSPSSLGSSASTTVYPTDPACYVLKGIAGTGVSSTVHAALCLSTNELVAVKVCNLEAADWSGGFEELVREASNMAQYKHDHLLPLLTAFVANGSELWMIMKYMEGGSVAHLMKYAHPDGLDEVLIATIAKPVLKALAYLHNQGGLHRDVKAGNVLVAGDGKVTLGDFGVSCSLERHGTWGHDYCGRSTMVGTPCWMSPEVMEQEEAYSWPADIWSFGITLLEMAHGHAPFAKFPPLKVLMMTLQNPPPELEDKIGSRTFSRAMRDLVAACLQKDPAARPSAQSLLHHRFFKQAKDAHYIAKHLLDGLPPLAVRVERIMNGAAASRTKDNQAAVKRSMQQYHEDVGQWDFTLPTQVLQTSPSEGDLLSPRASADSTHPPAWHQSQPSNLSQLSHRSQMSQNSLTALFQLSEQSEQSPLSPRSPTTPRSRGRPDDVSNPADSVTTPAHEEVRQTGAHHAAHGPTQHASDTSSSPSMSEGAQSGVHTPRQSGDSPTVATPLVQPQPRRGAFQPFSPTSSANADDTVMHGGLQLPQMSYPQNSASSSNLHGGMQMHAPQMSYPQGASQQSSLRRSPSPSNPDFLFADPAGDVTSRRGRFTVHEAGPSPPPLPPPQPQQQQQQQALLSTAATMPSQPAHVVRRSESSDFGGCSTAQAPSQQVSRVMNSAGLVRQTSGLSQAVQSATTAGGVGNGSAGGSNGANSGGSSGVPRRATDDGGGRDGQGHVAHAGGAAAAQPQPFWRQRSGELLKGDLMQQPAMMGGGAVSGRSPSFVTGGAADIFLGAQHTHMQQQQQQQQWQRTNQPGQQLHFDMRTHSSSTQQQEAQHMRLSGAGRKDSQPLDHGHLLHFDVGCPAQFDVGTPQLKQPVGMGPTASRQTASPAAAVAAVAAAGSSSPQARSSDDGSPFAHGRSSEDGSFTDDPQSPDASAHADDAAAPFTVGLVPWARSAPCDMPPPTSSQQHQQEQQLQQQQQPHAQQHAQVSSSTAADHPRPPMMYPSGTHGAAEHSHAPAFHDHTASPFDRSDAATHAQWENELSFRDMKFLSPNSPEVLMPSNLVSRQTSRKGRFTIVEEKK